jgi:hypothetical protein
MIAALLSAEDIAHICHDANRALCRATGDDSQPLWEDAPEWQRTSAQQGVRAIIERPDLTPEQVHELWCDAKRTDGWVYGDVKDPEAKTHPCLVAYDQLPTEQRYKDVVFRAIVRSLTTD